MDGDQMRQWIDAASYENLLHKWRFAPAGDPFFQGKTGDYYKEVMARKRVEAGNAEHTRISKSAEHTRISKSVGWE